ncbi:hypothetical protein ACO0QE_004466 [Hanseniaspora vineae]
MIPQTLMLNLQYYNTFFLWETPSSRQEESFLKQSLTTNNLNTFSATQDSNQIAQAKPFIFDDQEFQLSHMNQAFSQLISGFPNDSRFKIYDEAKAQDVFVTFQNISSVSDLQMLKKMLQSRVFSVGINMGDPLFSNIPHLFNHLNSLKTYRNSGNVLMYEKLLEIAKKNRDNGIGKHQSLETDIEQNCKELLQSVGELLLNQLHLVNKDIANDERAKGLTPDYNWLIFEKSNQTVEEEQQLGKANLV